MFWSLADTFAEKAPVKLLKRYDSMSWKIQELPRLKGFTIEWAENGNFILSRRNLLYTAVDLESPSKELAEIAAQRWRSIVSRFRLGQRFLRFMVTNVVTLTNGDLFVTFDKSVGIVRSGRYIPLNGLVRPCRVLRSACAVHVDGTIYFGEYLANSDRSEIRIYRYTPGADSVEIAHTFEAGSVRHIHGVYYD